MKEAAQDKPRRHWRPVLFEVIFEADTPAGKWFDILLIICILSSVLLVMLDSVDRLHDLYRPLFKAAEWMFTILFTIEYLLRLYSVRKPLRYAVSLYGIVDLLAILPTYIALFFAERHFFTVFKILRIMRVFRVFKLVLYLREAQLLAGAIRASSRKIAVFLFAVLILVVVCGSLMYVIESEENGFTSIPRSVYWAIVTLTTVGYGDISPQSNAGQLLAAVIMLLGYAIIAVPTGIVSAELASQTPARISTQACPDCSAEGHDADAIHCKFCGARL